MRPLVFRHRFQAREAAVKAAADLASATAEQQRRTAAHNAASEVAREKRKRVCDADAQVDSIFEGHSKRARFGVEGAAPAATEEVGGEPAHQRQAEEQSTLPFLGHLLRRDVTIAGLEGERLEQYNGRPGAVAKIGQVRVLVEVEGAAPVWVPLRNITCASSGPTVGTTTSA
jgi:hypothetical protein